MSNKSPSQKKYSRTRIERLLNEAFETMNSGLLEEGSKSTRHTTRTAIMFINRRVTNGRVKIYPYLYPCYGYTEYENRARFYWVNHISELIEKAINKTETYKKARRKLWKLIDEIVLEDQENKQIERITNENINYTRNCE